MNYWLLTTEYPPFYGGGIGTYCLHTARMFAQAGDTVTVFVSDDSIKDHHISTDPSGVRLIRFNSNRNDLQATLGYTARLSYAFADMVRTMIHEEGGPDIIEAQDYLGIGYYLTQFKHLGYASIKDIPIVITLHSPAFIYLEYNKAPTYRFPDFWTGEMEKQSIRAADLLLSPTHFLEQEIRKYMDLSDNRVEIVANPYQPPLSNGSERPFTPNKIVCYGKLSPQKGTFELLGYFRELWDNGFEYPLHIVGGTDIVFHPEMQTMGQIVRKKYDVYIKKGLLRLHGKIKPSQIKEVLGDAHILLAPSIVDNLPYAIIEAMTLGKVVMASVQGGQREMISDGVNGFLFDHEDPSSFGRQLKKILALPAAALRQVGENARLTVANRYAPDKICPNKKNILNGLLAAPRAKGSFPFLYQERLTVSEGSPPPGSLLSIVIPFYNMGAYLEECVRSLLGSTYKEVEIIIINDGSNDPFSIEILDKILALSDRISRVDQSNQGLADARNRGAVLARGQYLAFLDADDKVAADYYEKAIDVLRQHGNVYFVGSWVQYFGNSRKVWPAFTPQPPYALVHNPVNSSGLVYKRSAFLSAGLNDKKAGYGLEDYESVINMLHQGLNGVILPELLFYYRVRTGSMFRNVSREKLLYSNKYIVEKHSGYYAKFAPQVINLLNANGPGYLYENPSFGISIYSRSGKDRLVTGRLKSLVKKNETLKKIFLAVKKIINK